MVINSINSLKTLYTQETYFWWLLLFTRTLPTFIILSPNPSQICSLLFFSFLLFPMGHWGFYSACRTPGAGVLSVATLRFTLDSRLQLGSGDRKNGLCQSRDCKAGVSCRAPGTTGMPTLAVNFYQSYWSSCPGQRGPQWAPLYTPGWRTYAG